MSGPVVETAGGRLRGLELDGVLAFLGIPYASVPDDPALARFGPPAAPAPWRGERDATAFGPIAPQTPSGPGSYLPGDNFAQAEEARTLNVWTPACDDARRPVLVFVHGGAFLNGSGASSLYRGERLARRGAVVVTFNYRLGALGFLAHPALARPGAPVGGNYGLLDQLAALAYVRAHASAFGGDPDNVTLFGESAGAMSVADLLGAPAARGLFHRAVIQSGMAFAHPPALASRLAEQLAEQLGLAAVTRAGLLAVPVEELLAAQTELNRTYDEGVGMPFGPVVDGDVLPRHPAELVAAGAGSSEVAVLAGTNRDEFTLFSFLSPYARALDPAGLEDLITRYVGAAGLPNPPAAAEVVRRYSDARRARGEEVDPRALLDAFGTDWIFRVPLVRLLEAHGRHGAPTYCYRFDWPSPFADGALGACHGLELPFVFGTVAEPLVGMFAGTGPAALELSDQMQRAWVAFATESDPSHELIGSWPRYEPAGRRTLVFGAAPLVVAAPAEREREFLESHLGRYGDGGPAAGATVRTLAFLAPGTATPAAEHETPAPGARADGPGAAADPGT